MGDAASCARSIRPYVDVIGVARDVIGGERTGGAIDYFNAAILSRRCFPQTPGFRLVRPFVPCRLVPQRRCCRFESSRRRRCAIQRLEKTSPKGQEFVGDHRGQKAVFHERGRECLNHLIDVFFSGDSLHHGTAVSSFQIDVPRGRRAAETWRGVSLRARLLRYHRDGPTRGIAGLMLLNRTDPPRDPRSI